MKDFWREFGTTDACFPQMKYMHLFPRNLNKTSKAVIQASCGGAFLSFSPFPTDGSYFYKNGGNSHSGSF